MFNGFWDLSDFDKQNAYLFGCIDAIPVKRRLKIKYFPKYQCHYSRIQNPNRVYLGCKINIKTLYGLYVEFAAEKDLPTVSEDKYRRIFTEEYNIGFKFPPLDTCKTCKLKLKMVLKKRKFLKREIRNFMFDMQTHLNQRWPSILN